MTVVLVQHVKHVVASNMLVEFVGLGKGAGFIAHAECNEGANRTGHNVGDGLVTGASFAAATCSGSSPPDEKSHRRPAPDISRRSVLCCSGNGSER